MLTNPAGFRPRKASLAMPSSNSLLQTRPLFREGVTKWTTRKCLKKFKEEETFFAGHDGGLTPGQTSRLTVGCKISLALTLSSVPCGGGLEYLHHVKGTQYPGV
jgi:hypothetical protein